MFEVYGTPGVDIYVSPGAERSREQRADVGRWHFDEGLEIIVVMNSPSNDLNDSHVSLPGSAGRTGTGGRGNGRVLGAPLTPSAGCEHPALELGFESQHHILQPWAVAQPLGFMRPLCGGCRHHPSSWCGWTAAGACSHLPRPLEKGGVVQLCCAGPQFPHL